MQNDKQTIPVVGKDGVLRIETVAPEREPDAGPAEKPAAKPTAAKPARKRKA